jgi:predicted transcriptional regulator of viral defense system
MRVGKTRNRSLAELVDALQAGGRYTLNRAEATAALQVNSRALKKAVMRLAAKGRIAVPTRGFYVIVPLEYRSAGAPPPSWFIDELMRHLGRPYYVGVLSAAGLHGAAHQQPQEFQVVTAMARRPMVAGRARIRFLGKRHMGKTITTEVATETGTMRVSTPEATALDLVRYAPFAGGLGNVATVLAELAERIEPSRLVDAAAADGELVYAQRLGYLLDLVGAGQHAKELARLVAKENPRSILLRPGRPRKGCPVDRRWRVVVNERVEADV